MYIKLNPCIVSVLVMTLFITTTVLGCGAPQTVSGHVQSWSRPYMVLFVVETGQIESVTRANSFGFFAFEDSVGPCPAPYRVEAFSKRETFEDVVFHADGSGTPIWIEVPLEQGRISTWQTFQLR